MGTNLIEEARRKEIKKFIMVGTVCAYPKFTHIPFREEDIWEGYPEETNAPYGIAKKTLMQMVISYKEQYGFNGVKPNTCEYVWPSRLILTPKVAMLYQL